VTEDRATERPWFSGGDEVYAGQGETYSEVCRMLDEPRMDANAALIVEAVNAYDRLRAIEAAARAFMEYDAGPPDLPDDEWEPAARVLWDALSALDPATTEPKEPE
jgi:hypothetical protein